MPGRAKLRSIKNGNLTPNTPVSIKKFIVYGMPLLLVACMEASDPRRIQQQNPGKWIYYFDADKDYETPDGCCWIKDEVGKNVVAKNIPRFDLVPKDCVHGIIVEKVGWGEGGKGWARFRCK